VAFSFDNPAKKNSVPQPVHRIFTGYPQVLDRGRSKNPVPALALVVLVKTFLDFSAQRKEHGD